MSGVEWEWEWEWGEWEWEWGEWEWEWEWESWEWEVSECSGGVGVEWSGVEGGVSGSGSGGE